MITQTGPRMIWLRRGSVEWIRAWTLIMIDACDKIPDPESGEVWQYMGTVVDDQHAIHQFRHRHHPTSKKRMNVNIGARRMPSDFPDDYLHIGGGA